MTKEGPMTKLESSGCLNETAWSFQLCHSLGIRASPFVIRPFRFAEKTGQINNFP
jgi:hypothetical protein